MSRGFMVLLVVCVCVIASAAPLPRETDAARLRRMYGTVDDPDKDCEFEMAGDTLRIKIPPKHHSLNRNPGRWNAPRVARDAEGDFTVTVRVAFPIGPEPGPEADEDFNRFTTAGLVAWADDGETIRFVRRESRLGERRVERFERGWDWTGEQPGKGWNYSSRGFEKEADAAYLRLVRTGSKVLAHYSRDGKTWTPDDNIGSIEVGWKENVKVGLIAENGYRATFEATFAEYKLVTRK